MRNALMMLILTASTMVRADERSAESDLLLLPEHVGILSLVDAMRTGELAGAADWPILARYVYTRIKWKPMHYDAELSCEHATEKLRCEKGESRKSTGKGIACYALASKLERSSARFVIGSLECILFSEHGAVLEPWETMRVALVDAIAQMDLIQSGKLLDKSGHEQRIAAAHELARHGRR